MSLPFVSIVMPLYNEEKYIDNCIKSLFEQDYPLEKMEWIFVDGNSTDNTVSILKSYQVSNPKLFKILKNEKKYVPYGMNIGIKESKGQYIIRLDAHASYAANYISKCIETLCLTNADNVGGVIETKAKTEIGEMIAKVLSSKFGVGNSRFRTNGSGYVDTVPFGAFKREIFDSVGLYDERLFRNQDNELNYRIIKNGGKIYLSKEIRLSYYCRDTLLGLIKMALSNGKWNIITMKLCPGSMKIRHFIPLFFVLSILTFLISGIIFWPMFYVLLGEILLYCIADWIATIKIACNFKQFLCISFIFPMFHINYGMGSIVGLFSILKKKYNK